MSCLQLFSFSRERTEALHTLCNRHRPSRCYDTCSETVRRLHKLGSGEKALIYNSKPILALYSFADGRTAKYIGQFIDSDVHFINQIPWYMLGKIVSLSNCQNITNAVQWDHAFQTRARLPIFHFATRLR